MNGLGYFLPIIVTAYTVTHLATPIIKKWAVKHGLMDIPTERKIHTTPIPRLGGIAIFIGFTLAVIGNNWAGPMLYGFLGGCTIIIGLGIIDDIFTLKPWVKLIGQIVAALIVYFFGIQILFISNPFGGLIFLGWLSLPLTILFIVGVTNIINLIDGLDGLAAGLSAISACALFLMSLYTQQLLAAILAIALLGASLSFLRYNFAPAQIFMGDSGSMFLGFSLASISIIGVLKSSATLSIIIPLFVLGVPLIDTFLAIVRRIKSNKDIFEADNLHLHHTLLKNGLTQKQTVICIYIASLILGSFAFILSLCRDQWAFITLIFGISLIVYFFKQIKKNSVKLIQKIAVFVND